MPSYNEAKHLLSRTGFGALHSDIEALADLSWDQAVDGIVDSTPTGFGTLPSFDTDSWTAKSEAMTNYWLDRSRLGPNQLSEKMVLFWHGYLCSAMNKVSNHEMMFDQNHLFRTLGLGRFDELLVAVGRGPAMLRYLDNDKNRKGSPNENFARELMELFTVGVGNYSELDVTEGARAWTGETVDDNDNYVFRADYHDGGTKVFLGRSGNLRGPDTIKELVGGRTATLHAEFLARKLWAFFAYPNPDDQTVNDLASSYMTNGRNVRETLRALFKHPKFRSDQAQQGIVRSPIEFAVTAMRHAEVTCSDLNPTWVLRGMGQQPYNPPNVSGWRGNGAWLTESMLWAKGEYVNRLRWVIHERQDLPEINNVVSWNPIEPEITATEALALVQQRYDVPTFSPEASKVLADYLKGEIDAGSPWTRRSGLFYLLFLLPELAVA